jgi:hypothetical protein
MKDAIILQQAYEGNIYFIDMLRLSMQRHAAYALSHNMDYQPYFGDYTDRDVTTGGWSKIKMIMDALDKGYKYIFWIDTDAAIVDFETDLRDGFKGFIGCCEHNAKAFPENLQVPTHFNIGVTFVQNGNGVKEFVQKWWDSFPGHDRWMEQGSFNELIKDNPLFFKLDDKFNATVNVNMCEKPVIIGWHGVSPIVKRFNLMRNVLYTDHIKYKVV